MLVLLLEVTRIADAELVVFGKVDVGGNAIVFEKGPLVKLVEKQQLVGYVHKGYWQCMDTLREKQQLEKLWESGNAPWKVWEE